MFDIQSSAFNKLESEGRLLNAVLKSPTHKSGRFGFRGDFALKFSPNFADEKRPPEVTAEQVLAMAEEGKPALPFISAYLHSFEYLNLLVEALGDTLEPGGKYFMFCNNIDLLAKFEVSLGTLKFYVLPIDEATVYNETLELLGIDRNDLKKLDTGAKLDAIYDRAKEFRASYQPITFEEGLKVMKPVRNKNENRPV